MKRQDKQPWLWVAGAVIIIAVLWGWSAWRPAQPADMSSTVSARQNSSAPTTAVVSHRDESVAGVIAGLPDGSRFARLLSQTGVAAQLSGAGPYTVFVPTDGSFTLLPPGALDLTAPQLRRLVEYHVVSGRAIDVNAQVSGTMTALSKDTLNFSALSSGQSARINSAQVLEEYQASNGVVYLVNEVLLPPVGH